MTLTEFLLARIAEDEVGALSRMNTAAVEGSDWAVADTRVLAECEAKRQIVEEERWKPPPNMECDGHPGSYMPHGDYGYGYCMEPASRDGESSWTLRHLAAVYADHPDYRAEWRP